jgi:hypothetical protein
MILTKITTLEFSVAKRAFKANPELRITSQLCEVVYIRRTLKHLDEVEGVTKWRQERNRIIAVKSSRLRSGRHEE